MTKKQGEFGTIDVKAVMAEDEEFLRALVRTALQEVLEAEMSEALGAEKSERTVGRQGYRSGYYGRTLISHTNSRSREVRDNSDRPFHTPREDFAGFHQPEGSSTDAAPTARPGAA